MTFEQLRNKHPEFIYERFEISREGEDLRVYFDFTIYPEIHFRPEIIFPSVPQNLNQDALNNLIFNLGMVELLSYWKSTCSPKIIIKAGYLNEEQIKFWKKLLIKGLGEFFYTNQAKLVSYGNKIDFTKPDFVQIKVDSENTPGGWIRQAPRELKNRDLILVGGGKDSAVTLENIQKSDKEFNCLLLNPMDAARNIAKVGGCKNPIIVKRVIDPKLLELNRKGYLNGHTPFSAYLAFLATLVGVLYDYENIVVSNESSSDEANTLWNGSWINHQYSKTSEFEKDFREYSQKYLASTNYYSFLRSLGELKVSKIFSQMPKYHKIFISCNKGSRTGVWCGQCPKCVSTYLTLYPFLGEKTKEIFGKDLLNDETLIPVVKGLLRENNILKPFECVATVDEIKTAILLAREKAKKDGLEIPSLLQIDI